MLYSVYWLIKVEEIGKFSPESLSSIKACKIAPNFLYTHIANVTRYRGKRDLIAAYKFKDDSATEEMVLTSIWNPNG